MNRAQGATPRRKRQPIAQELRREVMERDWYVCRYCRRIGDYNIHIDHVIPVSRGGLDTIDNLVTACEACNLAKGDKLIRPEGWTPGDAWLVLVDSREAESDWAATSDFEWKPLSEMYC